MSKKFFGLFWVICLTATVAWTFTVNANTYTDDSFDDTNIDIVFVEDILSDEEQTLIWNAYVDSIHGEDYMQNQRNSNAAIDVLYASFPTNRNGETIYPDYYGGVYMDDNGNLVVLVVGSAASNVEPVLHSIALNDGVSIRETEFSYNEIMSTIDFLRSRLLDETGTNAIARDLGITSWGFGVEEGIFKVRVGLKDYSNEQIALFKYEIIDTPMIVFHRGEYAVRGIPALDNTPLADALLEDDYGIPIEPFHPTVHPGSAADLGSIGFRATRGGRTGFVTAAHVVGPQGSRVRVNGILSGTVEISRLDFIDAAFVSVDSGVNITNTVIPEAGITHLPQIYTPRIGENVTSIGAVSGRRSGIIYEIRDVPFDNGIVSSAVIVSHLFI